MPNANVRTDVVVIGCGIVGASSAWHLAQRGLRVVVLEAQAGPAEGSTGRSFSSVRAQWADPLNIEISWTSIQRYRDFPQHHGVDLGYRPTGYLLLVPEAGWERHLRAVALQRSFGVPVEVLDPRAASRRTPFDANGIAGATWGPTDGVVDPQRATTAFLALAKDRGAEVLFRTPVTAIERQGSEGGWTVVAGDRRIFTRYVVNAAGGWSDALAALAGLRVPVVHSRRNIYATAPDPTTGPYPMTIDTGTGAFLRSEGPRLLFGAVRPNEPAGYNVTVDWEWLEMLLPTMVERWPWFADLGLDRAACWAGTYELTPDHQPIVGPDATAPTFIHACGFSGHGVMQAPEIGRLVAEQVVEGAITSVDARPFGLERFGKSADRGDLAMVF